MTLPRTVIISLGFPRTGTTLVQKMFERGTGYFHQKLTEAHPCHPVLHGLLVDLVNVFHHKRVLVVRTTRAFPEVWESLKVGVEEGNVHPWRTREAAERAYQTEAAHWASFAYELSRPRRDKAGMGWDDFVEPRLHPQVEVTATVLCYEELQPAPVPGLRDLDRWASLDPGVDSGDNLQRWERYLRETWMREPVNVGRLERELKNG